MISIIQVTASLHLHAILYHFDSFHCFFLDYLFRFKHIKGLRQRMRSTKLHIYAVAHLCDFVFILFDLVCDSTRPTAHFHIGLQYEQNTQRGNNLISRHPSNRLPWTLEPLCKRFKQATAQLKLNKHPNNRMVLSISWYWLYHTAHKHTYECAVIN